jgi:hypothetical protein
MKGMEWPFEIDETPRRVEQEKGHLSLNEVLERSFVEESGGGASFRCICTDGLGQGLRSNPRDCPCHSTETMRRVETVFAWRWALSDPLTCPTTETVQ